MSVLLLLLLFLVAALVGYGASRAGVPMRLLLFLTSAFWIGYGAALGHGPFAYTLVVLGNLLALGLLVDQVRSRRARPLPSPRLPLFDYALRDAEGHEMKITSVRNAERPSEPRCTCSLRPSVMASDPDCPTHGVDG